MRRFVVTTFVTQRSTTQLFNYNPSSSTISRQAFSQKNHMSSKTSSDIISATGDDASIINILKRKKYILLDGGTGEELFRRGVPDDRKVWSATAVVHKEYNSILNDVHQSFIQAGSDMITTNSYGIVPGVGFSKEDIQTYVSIAGRIALDSTRSSISYSAENNNSSRSLVCGSLGPLVESYRPDLVMDHTSGVEYYQIIAHALSPYVDIFLAETMSSVEEASQVIDAIHKSSSQKPVMVSFTINENGILRSGEDVIDAIRNTVKYSIDRGIRLQALLFNCSEPEAITKALHKININESIRQFLDINGVVLGAYANRLTPVPESWTMEDSPESQAMRKDVTPDDYYDRFVSTWVNDLNVKIIGGCCGITPEHILYINNHL